LRKLQLIIIVVAYIATAQTAQLLIKVGAERTTFGISRSTLLLDMHWLTVVGLALYVSSFFMYIIVLRNFQLSYIGPIIVGVSYVLMMTLGVLFLKEKISINQIIGASIILIGLIVFSFKPLTK
jgi:drug/metabolite transporter (DMT)-like permease